jgi:hypothetical protein
VAIPLSGWIAGHWTFGRVHRWILSLRPYPTLLLFAVPLIVLEPVKPLAVYLVGTGHATLGLSALAIAEMLKPVLIERLFSVSRDKLLSIPAFAWAYGKYSAVKSWPMSFEAWQLVLRWSRIARAAARRLDVMLNVLRDAILRNRSAVEHCHVLLIVSSICASIKRSCWAISPLLGIGPSNASSSHRGSLIGCGDLSHPPPGIRGASSLNVGNSVR